MRRPDLPAMPRRPQALSPRARRSADRYASVILPFSSRDSEAALFWFHLVQRTCRARRQILALGGRLDSDLPRIDAVLHAFLARRIRSRVFPDKRIPVRHFHIRKAVAVSDEIIWHEVIQVQDIGRDRIDLIGGQRVRRREGHRTVDIIPQGRCERPVRADARRRSVSFERTSSDPRIAALTLAKGTVARRALIGEEVGAFAY